MEPESMSGPRAVEAINDLRQRVERMEVEVKRLSAPPAVSADFQKANLHDPQKYAGPSRNFDNMLASGDLEDDGS